LVAVGGGIFRSQIRATKLTIRWPNGTSTPAKLLGQLRASGIAFLLPDGKPGAPEGAKDALGESLRVIELERAGGQLAQVVRHGTPVPVTNSSHQRLRMEGVAPSQSAAVLDGSGGLAGLLVSLAQADPPILVPAERLSRSAEELWKSRKQPVPAGWLGVELQDLTRQLRKAWKPVRDGPVVCRVHPDSPATKAGIEVGDILWALGDWTPPKEADTQANDFADRVAWHAPNTPLTLKFLRGQEERTAEIALAEAPKDFLTAERLALPEWGLEVSELTQDLRDAMLLPAQERGLAVSKVDEKSEASVAGLMPLDLILKVSDRLVSTPQDFKEQLAGSRPPFRLLVKRRGLTRFILLGER
jgi:serine protease Do